MSDHELCLRLDQGWSGLILRCRHDINAEPWCGNYDEYGNLLDAEPTSVCWAAEWAGEVGAEDCLGAGWDGGTYEMPLPVNVRYDGDAVLIEPEVVR